MEVNQPHPQSTQPIGVPMSRPEESFNAILHAISDPTRRKILGALRECQGRGTHGHAGMCGLEIEQKVKVSQPTVSHHMTVLHKAGLIEVKKTGLWRWYQRNEEVISSFTKKLKQTL